jgi:hypothetical protein
MEGSMPLIKPRTRGKQLVRHIARLDRETNETLFAYAQFIGEPTDYVLNQVIDTVLGKDKDFQAWRGGSQELDRQRAERHVGDGRFDWRRDGQSRLDQLRDHRERQAQERFTRRLHPQRQRPEPQD